MDSNISGFNFYDLREENPIFNEGLISDSEFSSLLTGHFRTLGLTDSVSLRYMIKSTLEPTKQYPVFEVSDGSVRIFHAFRRVLLNSFYSGVAMRGTRLLGEYLVDEIKFNDYDMVVDCGANVGEFGVFLSARSPNLNYIAFEPGPIEYHLLRINHPETSTLFNVALSDRNETSNLFYKPGFADSSVIPMAGYDSVLPTMTCRLDEVLTHHNMRVKLLKLEAEGAEPEVLSGCDKLMERIDYISADLGFERGERQDSPAPAVVNFLLSRGFSLERIHPVRKTFLFRNRSLPLD